MNINKTPLEVPQEPSENLIFLNGKLVMSKGITEDTYYIGHEVKRVYVPELQPDEDGKYHEVNILVERLYAMPVTVPHPAIYEAVIDAIERKAYNLKSDAAALSFNASLARKSRINPDDPEVKEHDEFMNSVLQEVRAYFKPNDPRVKSSK